MSIPRTLLRRATTRGWWWVALPVVVLAIGAYQHRWLTDDGFINLRIVRQIEAGHGPVFNVGERVEAGTSILWLVVLTIADVLLPVRLEYLAAYSGIVLTLVGTAAITTAARRIGRRANPEATVLPAGALTLSVIAAMWDFASSGLETGLQFAWLGCCVLLLTTPRRHDRGWMLLVAAFIGLGPLIRPDLALFSVAFVVVLAGPRPYRQRELAGTIVAALALPLLYQVFRMGFFATLVPNTALAKNASGLRLRQGLRYLREAVGSYHLWLVLLAAGVAAALLVLRPLRARGERHTLRLLCLAGGAAGLHLAYIVAIGGDYMHARLLLPGAFVLLGLVTVPLTTTTVRFGVAAFAVWAVWCGLFLRSEPGSLTGIINEHDFYVGEAPVAHPITLDDYRSDSGGLVATVIAAGESARVAHERGEVGLLVFGSAVSGGPPAAPYPATVYLVWPVVGMAGYAAGTDVFIIDQLGLGDPIVSRLDVPFRGRPGHEKEAPGWAVLRLFPNADRQLTVRGADGEMHPIDPAAVVRLLDCPAVRRLQHDLTAPLTFRRFLGNMAHSLPNTLLTLPYTPDEHSACP